MNSGRDAFSQSSRSDLYLTASVRQSFQFLASVGFLEVGAGPTHVLFQKNDIQLEVYLETDTCALCLNVHRDGERYGMAEILSGLDIHLGSTYRDFVARTPALVGVGTEQLSALFQEHVVPRLSSDFKLLETLALRRVELLRGMPRGG